MLKSHERLHKIELDSMTTKLLDKSMGPRSNLTHAVLTTFHSTVLVRFTTSSLILAESSLDLST